MENLFEKYFNENLETEKNGGFNEIKFNFPRK